MTMLLLCILTCLAGGMTIKLAAEALARKRYFLFGFDVMMTIVDIVLIVVYIIYEFIL